MNIFKRVEMLRKEIASLNCTIDLLCERVNHLEMHSDRLDVLSEGINEKADDNRADIIKIKLDIDSIKKSLDTEPREEGNKTQLQIMDEWLNGEEGHG